MRFRTASRPALDIVPNVAVSLCCQACASTSTLETSERKGESVHMCGDCEHVWNIPEEAREPRMTHSVSTQHALAACERANRKP